MSHVFAFYNSINQLLIAKLGDTGGTQTILLMKKFKFIAFLLFATMLSVNLTSCGDDEPGGSQSITEKLSGEWFLVNMEYNYSDGSSYHFKWDYNNQTADGYCEEDDDSYPAEKLVISYGEVSGFRFEEKSYERGSWGEEESYYVSLEDVTNGTYVNEDGMTTNIKLSKDVLEITETELEYDGESVYKRTYRRIKTETEKPVVNASGKETFTIGSVSFNMVKVKGGTFKMGSNDSEALDREKPVHSVTLSDYYIGETEVTQELWEVVMGTNTSYYSGSTKPVEMVSWDDCQKFINKLNDLTGLEFRLPTEAEWEYAARGGNKSKGYKYAGSNTIDEVAWYYDNLSSSTHPVGTKSPNELGIYDMSGNVWEWCSDWYAIYTSVSQTNPTGPSTGSFRVFRGGGWNSSAQFCRVAHRGYGTPDIRNSNLGFRLVCSRL